MAKQGKLQLRGIQYKSKRNVVAAERPANSEAVPEKRRGLTS